MQGSKFYISENPTVPKTISEIGKKTQTCTLYLRFPFLQIFPFFMCTIPGIIAQQKLPSFFSHSMVQALKYTNNYLNK